jgi:hypothetical protein
MDRSALAHEPLCIPAAISLENLDLEWMKDGMVTGAPPQPLPWLPWRASRAACVTISAYTFEHCS